jgi:ABC-2 type transport system ATP-binding protein
VRASPDQRPRVARAVVGAGLELLRLDQGAGQLENIFLRLTHGQEVRA